EKQKGSRGIRRGQWYRLVFQFPIRELRLFATWMDWSSRLDNYASDDAFGGSGFNAGGEWNFGVQMETWF
ncbi:carbohydrate porin, partial [Escherichia coli]|nr:carbohydrate porin [Escherichia coli]